MLEDIIRHLRALLQNQFPAKLDQIELERADGVTLEDIKSFLVQGGQKDSRLKYPSVTILGENTTATNALSRHRELKHKISIWITDREVSPDSELSTARLWRYAEALERILASDPTLGGKAVDSVVTGHVYHQKEGEESFVRRALLIMEVLERPSTSNY
ncbi:MAG TPA: hypothetical protein ACFYD3_10735 [Candidatus Hypogeohydataceae bacterium YC41]